MEEQRWEEPEKRREDKISEEKRREEKRKRKRKRKTKRKRKRREEKKIRKKKESEERKCTCAKRVGPEGRKVRSLKRRVRSHLAR